MVIYLKYFLDKSFFPDILVILVKYKKNDCNLKFYN